MSIDCSNTGSRFVYVHTGSILKYAYVCVCVCVRVKVCCVHITMDSRLSQVFACNQDRTDSIVWGIPTHPTIIVVYVMSILFREFSLITLREGTLSSNWILITTERSLIEYTFSQFRLLIHLIKVFGDLIIIMKKKLGPLYDPINGCF